MKKAVMILDNIRSVQNVASIFRTADCAGVETVYLVGYTPAPVDRFGRVRGDFRKISLGAEESVAWKQIADAKRLIRNLRKEGYAIVAVEQAENSIDYRKVRPRGNLAVVLGNEVGGVPADVLDLCDIVAEIRMRGAKESLNVSVAAGIALFRFLS